MDAEKIEDIVNGTVIRAGEPEANMGRLTLMLAGSPVRVPAVTHQGESAERIAE